MSLFTEVIANITSSEDPIEELEDLLDLTSKTELVSSTKDIFCFQYGVVVFWGIRTEEEEERILAELAPYVKNPIQSGDIFEDG
jgi:uncharacterized Rmd1/YagE family protein